MGELVSSGYRFADERVTSADLIRDPAPGPKGSPDPDWDRMMSLMRHGLASA